MFTTLFGQPIRNYKHIIRKTPERSRFPRDYIKQEKKRLWNEIGDVVVAVYPFIDKNFGAYPYKQYSIIQGGDGGMEYPMATLVNGPSLGTTLHELMHSWYHGVIANNESVYPWMDEGFAEWATDRVQYYFNDVIQRKKLADKPGSMRIIDSLAKVLPKYHADVYNSYYSTWKTGLEEPLTTQADEYQTQNGILSRSLCKGAIFLSQLGYIAGDETLGKIMLEYYRIWKFKHPASMIFFALQKKLADLSLTGTRITG